MKAIFTGTERDLIECGFEKFDFNIVLNKKIDNPYYIRKQTVGERRKYYYQIAVKDNIIHMKEFFEFYFIKLDINKKKILIQDLIDKNLVRWE